MLKQREISEKIDIRTLDKEIRSAMTEVGPEVRRILCESYEQAKKILLEHRGELQALAGALMKHETLDGDAIRIVIARAVVLQDLEQL